MKHRSERCAGFVQSQIRAMTRACNAVGGVNLGQGICDVPTPEIVKQAAQRAIAEQRSTYTRFDGTAELRRALATKLERDNGVLVDPESEVVVTVGASGALACTLHALFDPGDQLLLFEPFYGYHRNEALASGLRPISVPLSPPDFRISISALEAALTPCTRALVVNTPVNPSGKVMTRAELELLASFCVEHDLVCVTDEVYEYMVYDGRAHVSMASLPGMRERTVTIGSYSKTFSITGWRIGYAAAPAELAAGIGLVNDLFYICAPHPLQHAVAIGINELPRTYYEAMCADYEVKRDRFCDALDRCGLPAIRPQGAYYVLADVKRLGCRTATEAAMALLEQAGVASVAGSAFFDGAPQGEQLVRFCYAKRDAHLDEAIRRLDAWA